MSTAHTVCTSRTPFMDACMDNDLLLVSNLLVSNEQDLEKLDTDRNTALCLAIITHSTEVAKLLIGYGAKVNHINKDRDTPLTLAVKRNNYEVVKMLLDYEAHINYMDKNKDTPLILAVERGHVEIAKLLLNRKARVNYSNKYEATALNLALFTNKRDLAHLLIEYGAEIDAIHNGKNMDDTNLTLAVKRNKADVVKLLLEVGADANHLNRHRDSPLTLAAMQNNGEIAKLLIENGAEVDHQNSDMRTALMLSSDSHDPSTLSVLAKAGAQLDCQDKEGKTALMMACRANTLANFELLLDAGADVSLRGRRGHSVLSSLLSCTSFWDSSISFIEVLLKKPVFLGRDYHLLILFENEYVNVCHRTCRVFPSFEYFKKDLLPEDYAYLTGQGLTPFSCALFVNNQDLARFFLHNWFLHMQDLSLGHHHSLPAYLGRSSQFLQGIFGQPWTLKSISFVHVSTLLGFGSSREKRVGNSGLPSQLQRWLRFDTPEWKIDSSLWDTLNWKSVQMNSRDSREEKVTH